MVIPTTDLLRLLERVIRADDLRAHPEQLLGPEYVDGFENIDAQAFATLARIAAGEAWEHEFPDTFAIPSALLHPGMMWRLVDYMESTDDFTTADAANFRRLASLIRSGS